MRISAPSGLLISLAALCLSRPASAGCEEDLAQARVLVVSRDLEQALEWFRKAVTSSGDRRDLGAQALVQIGDLYRSLNVPKLAEASYQKVLQEFSSEKLTTLDAHLGLAEARKMTGEWKEALEWFAKALPLAQGVPEKLAAAYEGMAEAQEQLGQTAEAVQSFEKLLGSPDLALATRFSALARLAALQARAGQPAQALETYERILHENQVPALASVNALLEIASLRRRLNQFEEAVAAYRRIICLGPLASATALAQFSRTTLARPQLGQYLSLSLPALNAQQEIVLTWLDAGKYDRALEAALVFLGLSREIPNLFPLGVELVAWTLKTQEGHLARANRFIQFQNVGPAGPDGQVGTADDLASPLQERENPSPKRGIPTLLAEALAKIPPRTPEQHRERGFLALYGGAPLVALQEFQSAFRKSELDQKAMQAAIQDLALALAALKGHWFYTQALFDYHQHGPAGPDGELGTPDDLKDPVAQP